MNNVLLLLCGGCAIAISGFLGLFIKKFAKINQVDEDGCQVSIVIGFIICICACLLF